MKYLLILTSFFAIAEPIAKWKFDSSKTKLMNSHKDKHHIKVIGKPPEFGIKGYSTKTRYSIKNNYRKGSFLKIKPDQDFNSHSFTLLIHAKPEVGKDGKFHAVFYAKDHSSGVALYLSPRGNWVLWLRGLEKQWQKYKITKVNKDTWEQFIISFKTSNPKNYEGKLQIWQNGSEKINTYASYKPSKFGISIGANSVGDAKFKGFIDNIEYYSSPLTETIFTTKKIAPDRNEDMILFSFKLSPLISQDKTNYKLTGDGANFCKIENNKVILRKNDSLRNINEINMNLSMHDCRYIENNSLNIKIPVSHTMTTN